MTSNPFVSVVVPVFNGARFLRPALESALGQRYAPLEIVAVDDGSTDESPRILQAFAPRIEIVTQKNQGVAAARNAGANAARGEWIAFLDQDDLWDAEKTAAQLAEVPSACDVLCCDARLVDAQGHVLRPRRSELEADASIDLPSLIAMNRLLMLTALVRRKALLAAGGFDPANRFGTDDYQLWLKLAARGHRFHYLPQVLASLRLHEDNRSHERRRMAVGEAYALQTVRAEERAAFGNGHDAAARDRLHQIYFDLGWTAYDACDFRAAAAEFRRALHFGPGNLRTWALAAGTHLPLRQRVIPWLRDMRRAAAHRRAGPRSS